MPPGTRYFLEVNPRIPKRLARLQELAHNLWYSWDRPTRALFAKLNPPLWDAVGHSPKALLKRIDEQRLIDAATDPAFLDSLTRVLAAFDAYHAEPPFRQNSGAVQREDLVAYFCAEFGIHESLPIYSGGLGILAGDHCKAASDFQLPFVAVGLMYRQGYFTQTIDGDGRQRAAYYDSDFEDLPIEAVKRKDGTELTVELAFPARKLLVKVWQARVGHVSLYLLDTDLPENAERERDIVHRLYGGDRTTRLEQEIVLGVGGMRALAALGFEPTVWHINEGHAAFLVLERVRALVAGGLALEPAIEAVASNTVFTTHTPVPAGHDQFTDATVVPYVKSLFGELGAPDKVAALARPPSGGDFNMTALAIRGSRHHNGVSRIHGGVSQDLPAGATEKLRDFLSVMPGLMGDMRKLLDANPVYLARTKNIAYLDLAGCMTLGVTGPVLRATGLPWDLRKSQPYCGYETYDFDVPVQTTCDAYGRYLVRMDEIDQSLRIIGQCVDRLAAGRPGRVMIDNAKIGWPAQLALGPDGLGNSPDHIKHIMSQSMEALIHHFKLVTEGFRVPAGQVYAAVEAPRGELGCHAVSDGGTRPYRVHFRDPSFANLQALPAMCEGGMVADIISAIASTDPVMGGVDR